MMDASSKVAWAPLYSAFILAFAAALAVLYIGEVIGQAPCSLCWFQRAFIFPLAIILAVAAYRSDVRIWVYALPLAAGGWLVAAFHTLHYVGVLPQAIEPCGIGPSCSSADMIFLGLPLPVLSVAVFTAIAACLSLLRQGSRQ
jgi:disulfide bond formation protein DsbB